MTRPEDALEPCVLHLPNLTTWVFSGNGQKTHVWQNRPDMGHLQMWVFSAPENRTTSGKTCQIWGTSPIQVIRSRGTLRMFHFSLVPAAQQVGVTYTLATLS